MNSLFYFLFIIFAGFLGGYLYCAIIDFIDYIKKIIKK